MRTVSGAPGFRAPWCSPCISHFYSLWQFCEERGLITNTNLRAGEMALQLRALAALLWGLKFRTQDYIRQLKKTYDSSSKRSAALSWPPVILTPIHAYSQTHSHTQRITKNNLRQPESMLTSMSRVALVDSGLLPLAMLVSKICAAARPIQT